MLLAASLLVVTPHVLQEVHNGVYLLGVIESLHLDTVERTVTSVLNLLALLVGVVLVATCFQLRKYFLQFLLLLAMTRFSKVIVRNYLKTLVALYLVLVEELSHKRCHHTSKLLSTLLSKFNHLNYIAERQLFTFTPGQGTICTLIVARMALVRVEVALKLFAQFLHFSNDCR